MNKQELITRNAGVKLYDLSSPKEMQLMKQNLYDCSKVNREPTFKLIAPFGHPLKYKADFYYFESENTPISEQILKEMGFVQESEFKYFVLWINRYKFKIEVNTDEIIFLNEKSTRNIKTANQLHQLIELLK